MSTSERTYDQLCPIAVSLDALGDRWTLLVLRDLLWQGPLGYTDLVDLNPGVSPTMMSTRLKQLTAEGLIARLDPSEGKRHAVYALTAQGRTVEPVIEALYQFGSHLLPETALTRRKFSYLIMLAGHNAGSAIWDLSEHSVELIVGDESFRVDMAPGSAAVVESDGVPDATLEMAQIVLLELLGGAEPSSPIKVSGSQAAAQQVLALLPFAAER